MSFYDEDEEDFNLDLDEEEDDFKEDEDDEDEEEPTLRELNVDSRGHVIGGKRRHNRSRDDEYEDDIYE